LSHEVPHSGALALAIFIATPVHARSHLDEDVFRTGQPQAQARVVPSDSLRWAPSSSVDFLAPPDSGKSQAKAAP
jgi:hypothetical protein